MMVAERAATAFSSEVETVSREENASKYKFRASVLIQLQRWREGTNQVSPAFPLLSGRRHAQSS
jgi:hypothetical protein